jgi:hypothetical protein
LITLKKCCEMIRLMASRISRSAGDVTAHAELVNASQGVRHCDMRDVSSRPAKDRNGRSLEVVSKQMQFLSDPVAHVREIARAFIDAPAMLPDADPPSAFPESGPPAPDD